MRWWPLAIAAAGCGFQRGAAATQTPIGDGAVPIDTAIAIDVADDAFDPLCFGPGPFVVCLPTAPTAPQTISGNVITSISATANKCANDTGDIVVMNGISVCAISGTTLALGDVDAGGALPLVFVATETITVSGDIAANSANFGNAGPGANPSQCGDMSMMSGTDSMTGAGGGAGGSFGGIGGNGGNGVTLAPGGLALPAITAPELVFRGGCAGGPGGAGNTTHALGGDGGGAVYLVARQTITLTASGVITVSAGGGGAGQHPYGGGGGGGAGGMIVLAAPTLMVDAAAQVFANGGSGGGGAGISISGDSGSLATQLDAAAPGGGVNDLGATPGGDGGYMAVPAGSPAQSTAGGAGGGGGAVGVIRVMDGQSIPAANVSPTPD